MTIITFVGQFLLNFLNWLDHTACFLTLGDPNETISSRTARARAAGNRYAKYACTFLTFMTKIVTFRKVNRDHCDYALDDTILPNTAELWNWDTGYLQKKPITEILDIEVGGTMANTTITRN